MSTTASDGSREQQPAELAGWHCSLDDPFDFQTAVLAWLDTNRIPLRDEILRGVAAVHLEVPAGSCPTVVVTRYQPPALHGQPPRLERHPLLTPPPPRPAECTLNRSAGH